MTDSRAKNQLLILLANLVLWPFFGLSIASAQSLDIQNMSPEQAVEAMLGSLQAEPPDSPDLNCEAPLTSFNFVKADRLTHQHLEQEKTAMCLTVSHYNSFIFNEMAGYWSLDEEFGLQLTRIQDSRELNGAYVQRPILNRRTLPSLNVFHYTEIDYNQNKAIWAHEYGHAILGNYVDHFFFPLSKAALAREIRLQRAEYNHSTKANSLSDRQDQLYSDRDKLSAELNLPNLSETERASKEKRLKQIKSDLAKVNVLSKIQENRIGESSNEFYKYLNFLVAPYHEFFADVFAGLYFKDLNKVGNSFDILEVDMDLTSDYRRFIPLRTDRVSSNTWNNYQSHHFFTPARHALGIMRVSDILRRGKEKQFLDKLANFILREIKWLRETAPSSVYLSYDELKRRIENARNGDDVFKTLTTFADEKNQLVKSNIFDDIHQFCNDEFALCKTIMLRQVQLGRRGIFLLSPDIVQSNNRLINAMEIFVDELSPQKR